MRKASDWIRLYKVTGDVRLTCASAFALHPWTRGRAKLAGKRAEHEAHEGASVPRLAAHVSPKLRYTPATVPRSRERTARRNAATVWAHLLAVSLYFGDHVFSPVDEERDAEALTSVRA